jgi:hypothetical protein
MGDPIWTSETIPLASGPLHVARSGSGSVGEITGPLSAHPGAQGRRGDFRAPQVQGLPSLGRGEHGHQRLESLFIDEGFGMLDPDETLDTVTQALETLRTDDRIVGIVTHLPQLAERLPAQIRVVKSRAGSHVEVVSE